MGRRGFGLSRGSSLARGERPGWDWCAASACRGLTFFSRSVLLTGLKLPHGGLAFVVHKLHEPAAERAICEDLMNGTYYCLFPATWTLRQGTFEFVLEADEEEFVPVRVLLDPTTGEASTVNTYSELACSIQPIVCEDVHSHADRIDGSRCICEVGFVRLDHDGGFTCGRCDPGHMPVEAGERCEICLPGRFSSAGEACVLCAPGSAPNAPAGADRCLPCAENSISVDGTDCNSCPADQSGNPERTECVCPAGCYNSSSTTGDNEAVCVVSNLHTGGVTATATCMPCSQLVCVSCASRGELVIQPGWAGTGADPFFAVAKCPFQHACQGNGACAPGHTGLLCAICEAGYGLTSEHCTRCAAGWATLGAAGILAAVVAVCTILVYFCCRPRQVAVDEHLSINPLSSDGSDRSESSPRGSLSSRVRATADHSSSVYLLLRTVYQPIRIIVGYMQVVTQVGPVLALDYPSGIDSIIQFLKPLAIDLQSLLQLDCLTGKDFGFYTFWLVRVLVIPAVMMLFVGLRYLYERRGGNQSTATGYAKANLFVVVFLLYPGVSNQTFSMFNCRTLGGGLSVLHRDYSVSCTTEQYRLFQLIAAGYVAVVALGIPICMIVLMVQRMREYRGATASETFVARRVADELHIDDQLAADAIRDTNTGELFICDHRGYYFRKDNECHLWLVFLSLTAFETMNYQVASTASLSTHTSPVSTIGKVQCPLLRSVPLRTGLLRF
eukprot:SAG22_NODE_319_length_12493_cov_33.326475_2_plen_727_part_00